MILVTVGSHMAFDRLVRTVDEWARERSRDDLFAQIGPGEFTPRHMEWSRFLDPAELAERMAQATLIIAHAGMGTIISALELGKPILVLPRREDLLETRSDHQFATARQLQAQGRVHAAFDEKDLRSMLDRAEPFTAPARITALASEDLISTVRDFIEVDVYRRRGTG
ncbi:MAG: glucuronosyltransferase [Planctomycetes bacterium]|nr:glucuronosyltransferase [Planctomycetota bacterium]